MRQKETFIKSRFAHFKNKVALARWRSYFPRKSFAFTFKGPIQRAASKQPARDSDLGEIEIGFDQELLCTLNPKLALRRDRLPARRASLYGPISCSLISYRASIAMREHRSAPASRLCRFCYLIRLNGVHTIYDNGSKLILRNPTTTANRP